MLPQYKAPPTKRQGPPGGNPVRAGVRVAELPVFLGAAPAVGLVAAHDMTLLLPADGGGTLRGEISWG